MFSSHCKACIVVLVSIIYVITVSHIQTQEVWDKKLSTGVFIFPFRYISGILGSNTVHHDLLQVSNCEVRPSVPRHAVFIFTPEDNKYNSQ